MECERETKKKKKSYHKHEVRVELLGNCGGKLKIDAATTLWGFANVRLEASGLTNRKKNNNRRAQV
jgi:hypothetical protein